MSFKIGEVAALSKVSVRTLHHYDEIGLLTPGGRTESGYRLYSRSDVEKLQQILFYRMLEFPLEKIQLLMADPLFDRETALREQRELISQKSKQLGALLDLIDRTLNELTEGTLMELKDMFDTFPEVTPEMMEQSEKEWGDTAPYKESMRRAKSYKKEDWQAMKIEIADINQEIESVYARGISPEHKEAIAAVDAARLHIDKWHFPCPPDFHVSLTKMTAGDERYRKNIDRNHEGLAAWMYEVAIANATQTGS
jgi:DNA-binding transcriptional MerR regulator